MNWTEKDATKLREAIGELRLRHGPNWGYYELARMLPVTMPHEVVAKAREGTCELAQSEDAVLRIAIKRILGKDKENESNS